MKEKKENIVESEVKTTVDTNVTPVVESTQDENQDENVTVDDNTEADSEPAVTEEPTPETPVATEPVVSEPVVTEPITTDPVVDTPIEDPTLATTDEVIPAPVNIPAEQVLPDENPIPDDPATIIPAEPAPVDVPGENINPDAACADGSCCDCGSDTCVGSPESPVTVAHFFGTIQECVTIIWRFHLKTRKHHVHVDLGDFYEGALDKVDNIIEQYQGICGVVEDPFVNCIVGDGKDEISYLQELKAFVENNKSILGDHSEINSAIDEFLGLIDTTLYKLTSFTESAVKSFEEFIYEDYNEELGEEE